MSGFIAGVRSWHFPCRRFDDLVADERAASNSKRQSSVCKGSRTHHDGCLQGGCRVALLETAFVALALFTGRLMGMPSMTQERVPVPRASRRSLFVHDGGVPSESWESLDGVDLADTCLQRVPMLQSCPHFPPRSVAILFFHGSPRTNQSQTGRRRESRNSSVEIVWTDPTDVVAQTTRISWHTAQTSLREGVGTVCCVLHDKICSTPGPNTES